MRRAARPPTLSCLAIALTQLARSQQCEFLARFALLSAQKIDGGQTSSLRDSDIFALSLGADDLASIRHCSEDKTHQNQDSHLTSIVVAAGSILPRSGYRYVRAGRRTSAVRLPPDCLDEAYQAHVVEHALLCVQPQWTSEELELLDALFVSPGRASAQHHAVSLRCTAAG